MSGSTAAGVSKHGRSFKATFLTSAVRHSAIIFLLLLAFAASSFAATRYVNVSNATPAAPYTAWSSAATGIQAAINAANSGDEIVVAPGTYLLSGSTVDIPVDKSLTLLSAISRAAVIDAQGLSRAMLVRSTNCVIEGFIIRNGAYSGYGGGVSFLTNGILRDCLVTGNRAWGGGGIILNGPAIVENCAIRSNQAESPGGGVILYNDSRGLLRNCIISDNVASNYGGGVYIQQGGTISNCWISGNRAVDEDGGGVYMSNEGEINGATMVNCVVTGNEAGQSGGGIYSVGPQVAKGKIVNCTVVYNTAGTRAGGISASETRLINDIIYFNTSPTNADLLLNNGSTVSNICTTIDYGWPSITNAPTFVDAAAGNFRLATASFCIDAGTTNGAPAEDFDGRPRPKVGKPTAELQDPLPPKCDMGAFEYEFHFNDIRFTSADTIQFVFDVQDRGIYNLHATTNNNIAPPWFENIEGGSYTCFGIPAGQFLVHTQTVVIPPPIPAMGFFRLHVSHTPF